MKLKYLKEKRKLHALDIYVIFSIVTLLVYTVVAQILSVLYSVQLDTLTTCFFAAFGGEILSACVIKIFKLQKPEQSVDIEDDTEVLG